LGIYNAHYGAYIKAYYKDAWIDAPYAKSNGIWTTHQIQGSVPLLCGHSLLNTDASNIINELTVFGCRHRHGLTSGTGFVVIDWKEKASLSAVNLDLLLNPPHMDSAKAAAGNQLIWNYSVRGTGFS
jgi:hypothetical protein